MRATNSDCRSVTQQIELRAKILGLIPMDARIQYQPGNTVQGHAPEMRVWEDEHKPLRVDFLPEFQRGYNTTPTEAYLMLCATNNALAAVEKLGRADA